MPWRGSWRQPLEDAHRTGLRPLVPAAMRLAAAAVLVVCAAVTAVLGALVGTAVALGIALVLDRLALAGGRATS
jgi:hypothetical protein